MQLLVILVLSGEGSSACPDRSESDPQDSGVGSVSRDSEISEKEIEPPPVVKKEPDDNPDPNE